MNHGQNPTYLIYGAGALGSVFGGLLQKTGRHVTYAGRGEHFAALQKSGLRITGIWGDHFIPPDAIETLSSMRSECKKFSIILICVKSKDTDDAAKQAASLLEDDGIMVSIQNGLNNWDTVARHVGEERTVGSRVIFGAEIQAPGLARVTVNADDVLLGEPFARVNRPLLQMLQEDLLRSGIPTRVVSKDEIWSAIWEKVLYNCSLNPLGAILEVPYGSLGESEESRGIIRVILEEIFIVMQAKGVRIPHQCSDEFYQYLMKRLLPPTVSHRASMLQDIQRGRMTEIDALNGAICQYARDLGIQTPYNDLLTSLIKFKEKKAFTSLHGQ
ncbi:MAG: 2-dehydropantoate 2-reductase [Methanosaeta sp. PtaB.Bin018]|jgi:2-dehydropantoate 2-reductase|nr:ketopantoate reductase family protein [Methanothrix sp.]OPX74858.1 MAG: 2-dehydropantoate 2-reductase [Methanosaeta sp. PtaB.Bin018]